MGGKIIHKNMERIRDKGYSMDLINDYRGASKYGNNKEKANRDKKKTVSPKRLDRKLDTYSSLDMDTSSSENDELELKANKSKGKRKVDRNNEGIGTSEIISSNNRKNTRTGKDFINDYRGASKYGNNKENSHCEVKRKSVSPERLDRKSATCSSFDMDTSSFENDELELRANKSKDRTKSDRDSEGIGTSETVNSESAIYSSLDMGTSSSENGELELRGNKSKDRTKVDRDSEGIGTNEIISSDGECSIVNKYGYSKCREKSKSSQKVASRKDNQCLNLYKRKE